MRSNSFFSFVPTDPIIFLLLTITHEQPARQTDRLNFTTVSGYTQSQRSYISLTVPFVPYLIPAGSSSGPKCPKKDHNEVEFPFEMQELIPPVPPLSHQASVLWASYSRPWTIDAQAPNVLSRCVCGSLTVINKDLFVFQQNIFSFAMNKLWQRKCDSLKDQMTNSTPWILCWA